MCLLFSGHVRKLTPQPDKTSVQFFGFLEKLKQKAYEKLSIELRMECEEWYESEPANIGQEILARLPPCPPTMQMAVEDNRFEEDKLSDTIYFTFLDDAYRNIFHENTESCFRQTAFTRCVINTMA